MTERDEVRAAAEFVIDYMMNRRHLRPADEDEEAGGDLPDETDEELFCEMSGAPLLPDNDEPCDPAGPGQL